MITARDPVSNREHLLRIERGRSLECRRCGARPGYACRNGVTHAVRWEDYYAQQQSEAATDAATAS
jgi:hypothetical protein